MLDWLKTILGAAYSDDIDKKVSAEIGKNFVSKADFNTLNTTKKTLEGQLNEANSTINTLKQSSGDNEALQKKINEHEQTIERMKTEAEKSAKTSLLRDEMRKIGVKDPDYLIYKHGGTDKFSFTDDGKPKDLEETVKSYRENSETSHLFNSGGYNPFNGQNNNTNPFKKETFNLTEQGKLFKENPDLARQYASEAGVKI